MTRQRQNNKTNVEPVHSYDAFHTRSDMSGVKGIIGMHRYNICLVVVLLWCENTIIQNNARWSLHVTIAELYSALLATCDAQL